VLRDIGLEQALRELGVLRGENASRPLRAISVSEVEQFCVPFLREIRVASDPRSYAIKRAVRSLRRATANLSQVSLNLPRSFAVRVRSLHPLTASETAAIISECADQLDRLRHELRNGGKEDPIKRWFRLRWKLFAKMKTGRTLPSIGELLFEALFDSPLAGESYERMLRRDERAIVKAKSVRTTTAKKKS
jgi:hypothetical protein